MNWLRRLIPRALKRAWRDVFDPPLDADQAASRQLRRRGFDAALANVQVERRRVPSAKPRGSNWKRATDSRSASSEAQDETPRTVVTFAAPLAPSTRYRFEIVRGANNLPLVVIVLPNGERVHPYTGEGWKTVTAPPIRVPIVADDQFTPAVRTIVAGATSGLTPIQRFAKALTLSEAREGTLVVRQMRTAVDELAVSALGTSGPLGRLIATLTQFGIGGGVGVGAVAGIGAIAIGIKQTIDYADQLEASFRRMDGAVAGFVASAGPLLALGDLGGGEGAEGKKFVADQPGLLARGFSRIQGFMNTTIRDVVSGRGIQPGDSEQAFDIESETGEVRREQAYGIRRQQLAADRARRTRDAAAQRQADAERRRKELDAQSIRDAELLFGFTGAGLGGRSPFGRTGLEAPATRSLALAFGESPRVPGALERDLGFDLATTLRPHPAAPFIDELLPKENYDSSLEGAINSRSRVDWRRLAGAGVGLAGAAAGGDNRLAKIFEAGGGLASAIPGGQIFGAGLGGLFGLFGGNKKPKVVIDELSDRALTQLRDVGAYVANQSTVVVSPTGGDALRAADYALQNASRLDATPRLPVPLTR